MRRLRADREAARRDHEKYGELYRICDRIGSIPCATFAMLANIHRFNPVRTRPSLF